MKTRRGDYPECEQCGAHVDVVSKQAAVMVKQADRDRDIEAIFRRLDKTVTSKAFYWIMGTLITVLIAVGVLYASSVDYKLEGNVGIIKSQGERLLEKQERMAEKMETIQVDVEKVKLSLQRNERDIDDWKRGTVRNGNGGGSLP